jgi:hypothetical protein
MPLPNHLKDFINFFVNRKSAVENTKLPLEALWDVIASTSCKSKNSTSVSSIEEAKVKTVHLFQV